MASSSKRFRNRRRFDVDSVLLPAGEIDDDATVLEGAVDETALRSFILEVSARRPAGVGDATDLAPGYELPVERELWRSVRRRLRKSRAKGELETAAAGDQANACPSVVPARRKEIHGSRSKTPGRLLAAADIVTPKSDGKAPKPKPSVRPIRSPRRRPRRRQGMPALVASTGFNCLVLGLLLAGKLPGIEPLDELLWSTAPPLEEVAFSEVDFETPDEELPVDGDDVADELIDPGMASFGELESAAALANLGEDATLPAGSLGGDMGALFGESGAGLAKFDDGLGGAPTARFFGQEIGTG